MIFYPKKYLKNVKEITIEMLNENKIKGLILDVDNTLIDYDRKMLEGTVEWCNNLKNSNIKICILSNSNKIEKVKKVAETLEIPYIAFAKKPTKKGFNNAKENLGLEPQNIAVVGDQLLTDIWGGNRFGMYTILTKPLAKKDVWVTRVKRPIENIIIRRYLKTVNKKEGTKDVY